MKRLLAHLPIVVPIVALAACGQMAPLRPTAGATLPPKAAAAAKPPEAEALSTPSDQSRPKRNDELLQNSEKRVPDKFDLPPSG